MEYLPVYEIFVVTSPLISHTAANVDCTDAR
jgi:hypothetical protein